MRNYIQKTDVDNISKLIVELEALPSWEDTTVNARILYNALQSYRLLLLLNVEDMIDAADVAIHENVHFANGTMDIEEAVRISVRAAHQEISENIWEEA